MATPRNFADELLDLDLGNGWRVVRKFDKPPAATGGHFSVGYEVQHQSGERAFLKAIDFSKAFSGSADPARVLQAMTEAFNHERDLCKTCSVRRMSKVVRYIVDGTVNVDPAEAYSTVQYLIFELAAGDVRTHLETMNELDHVFLLRTLHSVTVGLRQLHAAGLAHQDLKPSNVLQCDGTSKIGDLGRASSQASVAGHDKFNIAGDRQYAPINQLYGEVGADWDSRRRATDLYHLGNLAFFLFSRGNITACTLARLSDFQRPGKWPDGFVRVLPYLRNAFETALEDLRLSVTPEALANEITAIVRQLCDPDPLKRGHPDLEGRRESRYELQRYISWFDRLARRAELGLWGR